MPEPGSFRILGLVCPLGLKVDTWVSQGPPWPGPWIPLFNDYWILRVRLATVSTSHALDNKIIIWELWKYGPFQFWFVVLLKCWVIHVGRINCMIFIINFPVIFFSDYFNYSFVDPRFCKLILIVCFHVLVHHHYWMIKVPHIVMDFSWYIDFFYFKARKFQMHWEICWSREPTSNSSIHHSSSWPKASSTPRYIFNLCDYVSSAL